MNPENKKILIDKLKREKEAAFEKNQAEKIEKKHNQAKQRKKRQCENNSPKEDVLISFKDLTKQGRRHDSSVNTSGLKIISLMNQVPSDSNNYKTQSETICKPQIDGVTTKNPVASTSRSNLNQTSKVNETKKKCKKSSGLTSSERSRKCRQNMSEEKKSLLRERDKERKRKLLAEGKILKIKDLPKKKQVAQRDFWKKTKRNYRARIKTLKAIVSETPPESESEDVLGLVNIEHNLPNDRADVEEIVKTDNRENPNIIDDREIPSKNILRKSSSAKKRSNRNLKKLYREIQTLKTRVHCQKKEIKHIQKEKEKYKKRWLREKEKVKPKEMPNRSDSLDNSTILNSDLSPNTKVERMLKGRHVPKDVKRELVFGEAFRKQIQINFQSNELSEENKYSFKKMLSGKVLKKNRLQGRIKDMLSYKLNSKFNENLSTRFQRNRKCKYDKKDIARVRCFFECDYISRQCPGKKQFITKKKIKKQKKLLLHDLRSCYKSFKNKFPETGMSFATFYKLKPFWVVHPKLKDRETCACIKHDNFTFLSNKCFYEKIVDTRDFQKLVNNEFEITLNATNKNDIVKLQQWKTCVETRIIKNETKKIRITSKVVTDTTKQDIAQQLTNAIPLFKIHLDLMMHQLNYLRNCIENLQENEVVMQIDFSENYVSKLSSEIQSMHFGANKKQISIHTGVAYIINNGNTETFSFATLSDNLDHQAHAIWRHMTPVLRHLKTKLSKNIMHVKIFSDGPTSQYRNRFNMYLAAKNLNTFFLDAKIEWNFSAPGHGKGPMDGIGGTIKRLADRKILHGSDISSAQEFADIVKRSTKIGIFVIDKDVIQAAKEEIPKLLCKFNKIGQAYQIAWNVDGAYAKYDTRSLSCKFCTPGSVCTHFSVGTSCMKLYHNGNNYYVLNINLVDNLVETVELDLPSYINTYDPNSTVTIGTWVAITYGNQWYPGIVHEKVKDLITVKFLAKKGKNFIWPTKHDIQSLPCKDILCVLKSPPKSVSKSRPDLFFIPDEEEINVLFETQV